MFTANDRVAALDGVGEILASARQHATRERARELAAALQLRDLAEAQRCVRAIEDDASELAEVRRTARNLSKRLEAAKVRAH